MLSTTYLGCEPQIQEDLLNISCKTWLREVLQT